MSLETQLAHDLARRHPQRAAAVLDGLPVDEVTRFVSALPPRDSAALLERMAPHGAAAVLEALAGSLSAGILEALDLDVAARLARRLDEEPRRTVLEHVSPAVARTLGTLLRFPENTAGALMDPGVLALPDDLPVRDALRRVREASEYAQYNLYVVDREQRLVGVLNLRELLHARPRDRLVEVMIREPMRFEAHADLATIVHHPAWRDMRAVPVVDAQGGYLGAVRYRVVRQIEDKLLGRHVHDEGPTSEALGQVFAAGISGLVDALTGPAEQGKGRPR